MKLKPEKLKIGQKYFLIDYSKDEVVEGIFYNNDIYNGKINFDFKYSITFKEDGSEDDYESIFLDLRDGVLKENVGDRADDTWVENPIFSTREEAEAKKKKYILASLKAVRKLILEELKENTNQIKKLKGVKNVSK
jgi:hypothetical protein